MKNTSPADRLARKLGRSPSPMEVERAKRGLTQADVAIALKINQSYISLMENGRRSPSMETAAKIASFYGIPAGQFWPALNGA